MPGENATAEKILDAATALWAEKGYGQSTMRELAHRLGMGVSSLYFYFESKEQIVQFLYTKINKQVIEQFKSTQGDEKSLAVNFTSYVSLKIRLMSPHKSALIALLKEAVDPESALNPMSSASEATKVANLKLFEELVLRSGTIPKGQTADVARALWLLNLVVVLYWIYDRTADNAGCDLLIVKVRSLINALPLLTRMPGADGVFRLLDGLMTDSKPQQPSGDGAASQQEIEAREVDVVVFGGGPIGALYASFVKMNRPATKVLILEKYSEPGHKIGESTLSGFCKALKTVGIHENAMRSLFYPKNGLGFFSVDRSLRDLTSASEYILETFDETYQVERRVLDSLVLANARRLGITIIQGASVDVKRSTFGAGKNTVVYTIGNREYRARSPLVVDASGPAGLLAKEFGLWTSEGSTFQTSATWTYFKNIRPLADYQWPGQAMFPRDQYTQHLCLREGWLWYIPIVSWQDSPTANLNHALDACLKPPRSIPDRQKLSNEFGCPSEDIVSVGLVLRSDRDSWLKSDVREAFSHYRSKYPAINQLLNGASQIDDHYHSGQSFMQRLSFRGHARKVSGDGWLLVGDAAFFVDPLISPGLTGGTAVAYKAARATIEALENGRFEREVFQDFESFVHTLHRALEKDNQLVYMSFNHSKAIAQIQRLQEIDARKHFLEHAKAAYSDADTNVWGILNPSYQELQQNAWEIMRQSEEKLSDVPVDEQTSIDYDSMVAKLDKLLNSYLEENLELTPYNKANSQLKAKR